MHGSVAIVHLTSWPISWLSKLSKVFGLHLCMLCWKVREDKTYDIQYENTFSSSENRHNRFEGRRNASRTNRNSSQTIQGSHMGFTVAACILDTFSALHLWTECKWPSVYNPFPSLSEELGKESQTEGNDAEGHGRKSLYSVRVPIIRRVLWGPLIMFVTICLILYEPEAVNILSGWSQCY